MDEPPQKELTIDMKYYFSEAYKIDSESYSKEVEGALKNLIISEISNSKVSDVIVIGRKGVSLFQPYIKDVNGKNSLQGLYTIQLFSFTDEPIIRILNPGKLSSFWPIQVVERTWKRFFGNAILLTDAINSGNEISEVIESIKPVKISKVCGYLANKNGLSKLQKKYPEIQFSFPKIEDDAKYNREQDRLQHIYQSRLIPICRVPEFLS